MNGPGQTFVGRYLRALLNRLNTLGLQVALTVVQNHQIVQAKEAENDQIIVTVTIDVSAHKGAGMETSREIDPCGLGHVGRIN